MSFKSLIDKRSAIFSGRFGCAFLTVEYIVFKGSLYLYPASIALWACVGDNFITVSFTSTRSWNILDVIPASQSLRITLGWPTYTELQHSTNARNMCPRDFDATWVSFPKSVCVQTICNNALQSSQSRSIATSLSNTICPGGMKTQKWYGRAINSWQSEQNREISSSSFLTLGVAFSILALCSNLNSFPAEGWEKCRFRRVSLVLEKDTLTAVSFTNTGPLKYFNWSIQGYCPLVSLFLWKSKIIPCPPITSSPSRRVMSSSMMSASKYSTWPSGSSIRNLLIPLLLDKDNPKRETVPELSTTVLWDVARRYAISCPTPMTVLDAPVSKQYSTNWPPCLSKPSFVDWGKYRQVVDLQVGG